MKILLVSVNASYMHTNIAIRDLKNYADKYFSDSETKPQIEIAEYTINQPIGEVLRSIAFFNADWIQFSTYIWNAEYVQKLLPEIKKVLPDCILGAGGPEFGYGAKKYLAAIADLDFVVFGEGERTFTDMIEKSGGNAGSVLSRLSEIKGIYCRSADGEMLFTGNRAFIEDLDDIPFPYPEMIEGKADEDHKIYYYESSRGCPFSCAYCLSSVEKRVRFKSLERTCEEIQFFLDNNIKLVKFVDRTYNLDEERYIGIWDYILKHHNKKTMFHFEIEAEYLSEKALDFLQNVPEGVMQFEMGVQSANKKTLKAINRSANTEELAAKIKRIPRTIHQHLDLIAGLPFEDLESFGKSYDFVMSLRPDALQLGFLKILGGTVMEKYASENGWKWMESPVYETFSTPHLSFGDIAFLKDME
ncbi:MAG: radical SAM protein, partial [Treponema sp.]|nr:radical SAM protein [Treponema sp.]